jgi:transaldolase
MRRTMNHERESFAEDPGFGWSIRLDYLRRNVISSGEMTQLIEEDRLRGITSNPSIFDKVITGSHDYDDDIRALALDGKRADLQSITLGDDAGRGIVRS